MPISLLACSTTTTVTVTPSPSTIVVTPPTTTATTIDVTPLTTATDYTMDWSATPVVKGTVLSESGTPAYKVEVIIAYERENVIGHCDSQYTDAQGNYAFYNFTDESDLIPVGDSNPPWEYDAETFDIFVAWANTSGSYPSYYYSSTPDAVVNIIPGQTVVAPTIQLTQPTSYYTGN